MLSLTNLIKCLSYESTCNRGNRSNTIHGNTTDTTRRAGHRDTNNYAYWEPRYAATNPNNSYTRGQGGRKVNLPHSC